MPSPSVRQGGSAIRQQTVNARPIVPLDKLPLDVGQEPQRRIAFCVVEVNETANDVSHVPHRELLLKEFQILT